MGAGGIGGIVAATLTEVGSAVTVVSTNQAIRAAVDKSGLRVVRRRRGARRSRLDLAGAGGTLRSVHARDPAAAGRGRGAHRAASPRRRRARGRAAERPVRGAHRGDRRRAERVIGAIVAWGASMPEPGVYDRTAPGGFVIGRIDGAIDADLERVGELLEAIGAVTTTTNLMRRALEQARAQLRGQRRSGTIGGESARADRARAPVSPARARDHDRGGRGRARARTCSSRRCRARSISSGSR